MLRFGHFRFNFRTLLLYLLLVLLLITPIIFVKAVSPAPTATISVNGAAATSVLQTQLSTNNVWSGEIDQAPGAQTLLNALHPPLVRLHVGDDGWPVSMPEVQYDKWDFSALNTLVHDVRTTGGYPLMNIKFAPDWMWTCYPNSIGVSANQTQGIGTVKDLTFQTYAQYMARLVSYYNKGSMTTETGTVITNPAGTSNTITYWELWNEPDLNGETPCAPPDGFGITYSQYLTMWNAVTAAMLAVDPTLKFVGPATAGSQFGSSPTTGNQYIDTLMSGSNIKPAAISFHGYGYWDNTVTDQVIFDGDNSDPENHCCGGITDIVKGVTAIHAAYPSTPIWLTEVNVNADWGNDSHQRPWTAYGVAWWGALFQQVAPLGVGIINQYDIIDSPQFGLLDDQTGAPRLPYWEMMLLEQAFPAGSTILNSSTSKSDILPLAVQKPDGTISILVINRQVNSSTSVGGPGLPATVAVQLQGITPTALSLQQIDATTNPATGPATVSLPVSAESEASFAGYGMAVLTIHTSGTSATTATATPTPTPTSTPTPIIMANATAASGSNLPLYVNAVSSAFTDNSFGFSSRTPCDTKVYVTAPCSYAIAYRAYGAIEFRYNSGSINPNSYHSLDYNIHTGGQPIKDFGVIISDNKGGWINEVKLSSSNITQSLPGGWVHISLPLSQLDSTHTPITTIDLENALPRSMKLIHVDDVYFASS